MILTMMKLALIQKITILSVLILPMLLIGANNSIQANESIPKQDKDNEVSGKVFVQLFEWSWPDIAKECEDFLGPKGYAAVQISPPQEHITGPQWWTRYQPVSYKIESRGGNRAEFSDMVQRCKTAGVDIYADTIANHMAGIFTGKGVAGSDYTQYQYPVPYSYDDFHHCGRNGDGRIANYQDLWEVQNCSLGSLVDLDTANPAVQKKIAAYIKDLLSLGVSGLRLDAVKHVDHNNVRDILALVDSNPFIFQEVIDRGGEPINAMDYAANGHVTEFKYPGAILRAFKEGNLTNLATLGSERGYLPTHKAIVFIDNHDIQRGHATGDEILNYKNGALYDLANVFMLGWPYGYPLVMSSYHFDNSDQGPPMTRPVEQGKCTSKWVCEHRRPIRSAMVQFRKATSGLPVSNWQSLSNQLISFGRGDKGHLLINIGSNAMNAKFVTSMKPGEYCNIVSEQATVKGCNGKLIQVDKDGIMETSVAPMSAVVILN